MPLLSFVAAAEDDAAMLLGPELADVEVLAIGGSPDASSDPRVRALTAPPGGAAAARNLALDEAAGDYLWFLEPGTRLEPGALAGVAERLRSAQPDGLLVATGPHQPRARPGPRGRGPPPHPP